MCGTLVTFSGGRYRDFYTYFSEDLEIYGDVVFIDLEFWVWFNEDIVFFYIFRMYEGVGF